MLLPALAASALVLGAVAADAAPERPPAVRAPRTASAVDQADVAACNPKASSLRPSGPPQVTPGSFMAKIRARGYLIAGVDQSTYHFGFLNPLDGQIEGFDIDMIRAVAQAIFGNPDKVEYQGDLRRAADTRCHFRRRGHRGAHDDDHLRPAAADRLLQRLLRRGTSVSWC